MTSRLCLDTENSQVKPLSRITSETELMKELEELYSGRGETAVISKTRVSFTIHISSLLSLPIIFASSMTS